MPVPPPLPLSDRLQKPLARWYLGCILVAKTGSTWPKIAPRWPKTGSRWPKMAQDCPKMAQDRPNKSEGCPKMSQDGLRMAQDGPEMAQDCTKMAPRWPQNDRPCVGKGLGGRQARFLNLACQMPRRCPPKVSSGDTAFELPKAPI